MSVERRRPTSRRRIGAADSQPQGSNAKAKLEAYFTSAIPGANNAELRATVRAAWDLANKVAHGASRRYQGFAAAQAALMIVRTGRRSSQSARKECILQSRSDLEGDVRIHGRRIGPLVSRAAWMATSAAARSRRRSYVSTPPSTARPFSIQLARRVAGTITIVRRSSGFTPTYTSSPCEMPTAFRTFAGRVTWPEPRLIV